MKTGGRGYRREVDTMLVVGVGLIGGSLALAAKARGIATRVVGLGRGRANLDLALRRGIVDVATVDCREAAAGADLVLLAVPVGSTVEAAGRLLPHLPAGAVITDAGSVKAEVVRAMDDLLEGSGHPFVGAHPIAGTELSGAGAARPDLFQGRRCIVTPGASSTKPAVALVRGMWERVGMEVVEMPAPVHDRILALVSHLPHLLAFALVRAADAARTEVGSPLAFAGSSFADATRVAASSPEMWRDICMANRAELLPAIDQFMEALASIRDQVEKNDSSALDRILAQARAIKVRQGED